MNCTKDQIVLLSYLELFQIQDPLKQECKENQLKVFPCG